MTTLNSTYAHSTRKHGGLKSRLLATVATWQAARKTRKALSSLSDDMLDDIGLCRADITTVAHRSAR